MNSFPNNWHSMLLKDSGKWLSGGTPSTTTPEYWSGDIPWISSGSLTNFRLWDSDRRITELGAEHGTRMVSAGTILMVVRGMSLKTEFRLGIAQRHMAFGQDCKALVAGPGIDPEFLAYAIAARSQFILGIVDEAGHGTGRLNSDQLYAVEIGVPPLKEQRAIAEVLGAVDDKIAANTKLSETALSLLEAHFASLGLNRDPAEDETVVGLEELVNLNPKLAAPTETDPVYVDMQKLPVSNMSISAWDHRPAKGGARFMNGDTLLARITPCLENRKTGFVDFLEEGQIGIGSTEFIVLRSRPGVPVALSYFLAISKRFRTFGIRHMVGTSGRQRVAALDLAGYTVGKPAASALTKFGNASGSTFPLLKSLTDENRTLAATRDALLPQLMSGKLRVKDAEKALEDAGV